MNFYRLLLMITFFSFFQENAGSKDKAASVKDWVIEKAIPNFIKNNRKVQGIIAIILAGMAAEATYSINQNRKHKKKFEEKLDLFLSSLVKELQLKIDKIEKKGVKKEEVIEGAPEELTEEELMKIEANKVLGTRPMNIIILKQNKKFFEAENIKNYLLSLANSKGKNDFNERMRNIENSLINNDYLLSGAPEDKKAIVGFFKEQFKNQLQEKRSFFVDAFQSIKTKINEKLGR